jgi:uncharacterized protein
MRQEIAMNDSTLHDELRPASPSVSDNEAESRFELTVDGQTAFLAYDRTDDTLTVIHTEVPVALRGRHLGERLVEAALQTARSTGRRVVVICPFARAYMQRHPESR